VSAGQQRRLSAAEAQATTDAERRRDLRLGRVVRERAEAEGIPCWSAAQDADFAAWFLERASDELAELVGRIAEGR